MTHTCHAHGCNKPVPPKMWGCREHWFALPKAIQRAIWRRYRPGQEQSKDPSPGYMAVQRLAVAHTAWKDNDEHAQRIVLKLLEESANWRVMAVAAGQPDPMRGLQDDNLAAVVIAGSKHRVDQTVTARKEDDR